MSICDITGGGRRERWGRRKKKNTNTVSRGRRSLKGHVCPTSSSLPQIVPPRRELLHQWNSHVSAEWTTSALTPPPPQLQTSHSLSCVTVPVRKETGVLMFNLTNWNCLLSRGWKLGQIHMSSKTTKQVETYCWIMGNYTHINTFQKHNH